MFARTMDILLLAAALSAAGLTFAAFGEGYSPVPWNDSWTVMQRYAAAGFEIRLADLFGFHSEHRPLFARLPLLLDLKWFGGRSILPFGLTFAAMAAHACLLWWIARKQPWYDAGRHAAFAAALAIFCCFSPAQLENVLWNFQPVFVLHFFFATAAFVFAARGWPPAAILCGAGAALCLASGVLVWWMLIALALAMRLPRRVILLYAVSAALCTALYMAGYQRPADHSDPWESIGRPVELLHYVAIYFGASWATFETGFGEILFVAMCGFGVWRLVALLRRRRWTELEIVPFAVMVFALATASLTALGRLRFGLEQAGSSRYQTSALLFWWAAALIVLPHVRGLAMQPAKAVLAGAMAAVLASAPFAMECARGHRVVLNAAEAAWVSGANDVKILDSISSRPSPLVERAGFAARGLGLFSHEPGSLMGKPWAAEVREWCEGEFRRAGLVEGSGQRLRGRAGYRGSPVRGLVVVDSGGSVIGIGVGESAYAVAPAQSAEFRMFALVGNGRPCRVRLR